jgi:hypothetical protein
MLQDGLEIPDKAEFYSGLIELFNDGWFYAVKIECSCPEDLLVRHTNYKNNGQLIAPSKAIIMNALHVLVAHREQIQPGTNMFYYWDPSHEANPY